MRRPGEIRMIEWVGQPSIFDDPRVIHGRITGKIGEAELRILRVAASKRLYRVDGAVVRELRPDQVEGLSKTYRWGPDPGSYVQPMSESDWALIRALPFDAKQFRDVTDGVPAERFVLPQAEFQVVKEEHFRSVRDLLAAPW